MKFQNNITQKIQVLFIVLLVSGLRSFASGEPNCDPTNACGELLVAAGTKVPDPLDCHNYYICIETGEDEGLRPSDAPLSCGTGQYFNPDAADCADEDYSCANPCSNRDCHTNCDTLPLYSLIAYPDNCNKYFVCLDGGKTAEAECPSSEPYFDGATCVTTDIDCCDICTPYCETAFTEVIDPKDCTNFYLCLYDNYTPGEEENYYCGDGQYFDTTTGLCTLFDDEVTSCNTACNITLI